MDALMLSPTPPTLSIVAPAYNEERNLPAFLAAIIPILERLGETFEIVFVDDGSRDNTLAFLAASRATSARTSRYRRGSRRRPGARSSRSIAICSIRPSSSPRSSRSGARASTW
jgi:glycosyltransferase involved in cell wall biosynthesis